MDTDEEEQDEGPILKRRRVLTQEERLNRTSKGRMQRVIDRVKKKNSGIYKEAGAARQRAKQEKMAPMERLNEMKIVSTAAAEYDLLVFEKKLDHVAKNMGKN